MICKVKSKFATASIAYTVQAATNYRQIFMEKLIPNRKYITTEREREREREREKTS